MLSLAAALPKLCIIGSWVESEVAGFYLFSHIILIIVFSGSFLAFPVSFSPGDSILSPSWEAFSYENIQSF